MQRELCHYTGGALLQQNALPFDSQASDVSFGTYANPDRMNHNSGTGGIYWNAGTTTVRLIVWRRMV